MAAAFALRLKLVGTKSASMPCVCSVVCVYTVTIASSLPSICNAAAYSVHTYMRESGQPSARRQDELIRSKTPHLHWCSTVAAHILLCHSCELTFANLESPSKCRSTPSPADAERASTDCAAVAWLSSSGVAVPSRHAATNAQDSGEQERMVSVLPWKAPAVEQASYVGADAPPCIRAYAS